MIDRERLNQRVRSSGYKRKYLAQAMRVSDNTLRNKLSGKTDFKLGEAQRLGVLLGLSQEEQVRCFWYLK